MKLQKFSPVLAACLLFGCVSPAPAPALRQAPPRQPMPVSVTPGMPQAPVLKQVGKGRYYVRKPWTVELRGRRWVVPRGYTCNGITAPDRFKASLGDGIDQKETWAAVFHDWLFTHPGVTRAEADRLFYDLLIAYGVPSRKAALMFTSVSMYSLSKKFR